MARNNHKANHRNRPRHIAQRPAITPRRKHLSTKRSVAFTPPSSRTIGRSFPGSANEYKLANYNTLSDDDLDSIYTDSDDPQTIHSDTDCSVFQWEEEATLLDDLMDQPSRPSSDESFVDLVESLQTAFLSRGKHNKQEIAKVLVPCHNEIKQTTMFVQDTVTEKFANPLMLFNEACKETESSLLERREALIIARTKAKKETDHIMAKLRDLHQQRANVWKRYKPEIDAILDSMQKDVADLPARIERKITQIEKDAKAYEKVAFPRFSWNDVLKG